MQTTTIEKVESLGKQGQWNKFHISLADGNKASLFTSKEQVDYKQGDQVKYEIETKFGALKFKELQKVNNYTKSVNKEVKNNAECGSPANTERRSLTTQESICKQVALKSVVEMICADKADIKQIFTLSDKIFNYLTEDAAN